MELFIVIAVAFFLLETSSCSLKALVELPGSKRNIKDDETIIDEPDALLRPKRAASVSAGDCWWSGCQPTYWAQRGCSPGYYQINSRPCEGSGDKFHCCSSVSSNYVEQHPQRQNSGSESGICSWYGADGEIPEGHPTASGEPFNRFAMKAAHKLLPFGTRIRVFNKRNGNTIDVTINDRGPYVDGRIVDLSFAAFGQIANRDVGIIECSYSII